jgi:hypothetical protein
MPVTLVAPALSPIALYPGGSAHQAEPRETATVSGGSR